MALNKSLQSLPPSKAAEHNEPPSTNPIFAPLLAEAWAAKFVEYEPRPMAAPAWFRHSDAASCARYLGYKATATEVSDPLDLADYYRFNMGHLVHDQYEAAVDARFPGVELEHAVTHGESIDGKFLTAGSGDLHLVLSEDGKRRALELKTINGYGFQRAIGLKSKAEGPRHSAKIQGALNAKGVEADELVIVLLSLDCISSGVAAQKGLEPWQRFSAEWRYPRDQYEPWADAELERLTELAFIIDAGHLPDRAVPDPEIPAGALIVDPEKGRWTLEEGGRVFDTGTWWGCGYCPMQKRCIDDLAEGL